MSEFEKDKFDVSTKIFGSDVEFHDGSTLRLNDDQSEEKLFLDVKSGKTLDTHELVSFLLARTGTTKLSLFGPVALAKALEKGVCVGKPALEISFVPESRMLVGDNLKRDIKRVVLDVEFTVRSHKTS
jgi:hypothetical protein